jgi:hypothetical protein
MSSQTEKPAHGNVAQAFLSDHLTRVTLTSATGSSFFEELRSHPRVSDSEC